MTNSIIPNTNTDGCFVSEKTNIAQNAFWSAILGKEVKIHINDQGEDDFKVLQVDQFFVIVEHEVDGIMMIGKSAIISVIPYGTAQPDIIMQLTNAYKQSNYKPASYKTEKNRKELNNYTSSSPEPRKQEPKQVEVVVKKKRSYDKPNRPDG